jgi:DNA-binding transcriptional LysR family regulator
MLDNLKAFAAVIDHKSLTKAALRLYLTQSAISRRIQQLEEALGGTLLDRTQRPPSFTALGPGPRRRRYAADCTDPCH